MIHRWSSVTRTAHLARSRPWCSPWFTTRGAVRQGWRDAVARTIGRYTAAVWTWLRARWTRFVAFVDDSLPMPPDQRRERDWTPEDSESVSRRRRLRLKVGLREKRGKGGFR
jgi:hypothetical protein